jgi:cytochrome c peroxidase
VLTAALPPPLNAADYVWDLPQSFSPPRVPAGNPMSQSKVALGRYLFYDRRMSTNGAESCASCHHQELAFTDGRATALGATGQNHPRSAMSLVNVAYSTVLTWSNPTLVTLEEQALVPMMSDHPVELGMGGKIDTFLARIQADQVYRDLFPQAFPDEKSPFTLANVAKALAAFERSIISARSPYDRYHYGNDRAAISDSAQRGEALFFNNPIAGCSQCHSGPNFTDSKFHNTGLYNVAGAYSYPAPNLGIFQFTHIPSDVGKFRTPTLRNVALTAPYMHDGSIATLEEVLDHYEAGGRTILAGPYAGRGHENPHRDPRIAAVPLTAQNRQDLLAFLRSLTDDELIHDNRFSDPFAR